MSASIIAVIITYNRKELLRQCLDAVLAQTFKPNVVIVVNNGSGDGTREMLDSEYATRVARIHMIQNVGAAGAYYRGMKGAYDNGADWLWMMDDDGLPAPDALEQLIRQEDKERYDLLNSLIVAPDDTEALTFPPCIEGKFVERVVDLMALCGDKPVVEGYLSPFNGILIQRSVLETVGYPRPEMFIWGDEMDYMYRVKRSGAKYGTLFSARHMHPRWKTKKTPILQTLTLHRPSAFNAYARNLGYLSTQYRSVAYRIAKPMTYVLHFVAKADFKGAWNFIRYWLDGCFDRFHLPPSRAELTEKGRQFVYLPAGASSE